MNRYSVIFVLFVVFLLGGCHGGRHKEKPVPDLWQGARQPVWPADTLLTLHLQDDTSLTASVYLPPGYNDTARPPMILLFDPHGNGSLPVKKYRRLARQYGYILAGSNNIRNGMNGTDIERILHLFTGDLFRRFSFDSKRVYAAGFSGGARVATLLALTDPTVRGVAACGGGLPSSGNLPPVRFDLLGFAGEEDFNLPELLQLDVSLQGQPCRHFLVRFAGKHEWPPATVFEDAFYWFAFNAMRDSLLPRQDTFIRAFINKQKEDPSASFLPETLRQEYQWTRIIAFLQGLMDTQGYEKQLSELRASSSFQKAQEDFSTLLLEEKGLEQYYLKNFPVKTLSWWKGKIAGMNRKIAGSQGARHYSYLRVMHYLSLAAYMQTEAALKRHLDAESAKYLALYKLLDPENPDVWFFDAVYNARKNNREAALRSWAKAETLGFSNKSEIRRWPELAGMI